MNGDATDVPDLILEMQWTFMLATRDVQYGKAGKQQRGWRACWLLNLWRRTAPSFVPAMKLLQSLPSHSRLGLQCFTCRLPITAIHIVMSVKLTQMLMVHIDFLESS